MIPHHWVDDDEDGDSCYFDPEGDSGWLRVSLITKTAEGTATREELRKDAVEAQDVGERLFEVGENVVRASVKENVEEGERIQIHFWKVGRCVSPDLLRIAIFSYTVPESRTARESWPAELKLIEDLVTKAEFIAPAN